MKKTLLIVASIVIVGMVIITFLLSALETQENSYKTYNDADKAGAIGRGRWIPALLPRSATQITEIHNIDANWILVKFSFGKHELQRMVHDCDALNQTDVSYPFASHTRKVNWWPDDLSTREVHDGARNRYKFYRCGVTQMNVGGRTFTDSEWLAVDEPNLLAFFWRKSG